MDDISVHIRVLEESWNEKKVLANNIANTLKKVYPNLKVYIIDVEEVL